MSPEKRDEMLERNLRSLLSQVDESPARAEQLDEKRAARMAEGIQRQALAGQNTVRSSRGWFGWTAAAVAAAALVIVSGLFAFNVFPSGHRQIVVFNTSDKNKEHKFRDGTQLSIAPGASVRLDGPDDSRRIRQFIRLESGQVEVRAAKAPKGGVACRIETPEGLWVETIGTIFKVERTYENERGERNVDIKKLSGAAMAVLLVAVTEGEVRTGRGYAEEGRVAAGGEGKVVAAEVKAIEPTEEARKLAARVEALKQNIDLFRLDLMYHGDQDKPFYRLLLSVPPVDVAVDASFNRSVRIDKNLALKLVDRLAAEGFLGQAISSAHKDLVAPVGPCYTLTVRAGKDQEYYGNLGWDLAMLRRLDGIARVLDGDAGASKDMGLLIGRLSGLRKQWEGAQVSWGQESNGLQAGLSAKQAEFAPGKPMEFVVDIKNSGKAAITAVGIDESSRWRIDFTPKNGGSVLSAQCRSKFMIEQAPGRVRLAPGEQKSLVMKIGHVDTGGELTLSTPMPAGKYFVTAVYDTKVVQDQYELGEWQGRVVSGSVEIGIVGSDKGGEKVVWGQAVNGLQGRLEVEKGVVAPGGDIKLTFWLRADEKQKESLFVWDNIYSNGYRNDSYVVKTPDGKEVTLRREAERAWDKNAPAPVEIKPGVPWKLGGLAGQVNVKSLKALGLDTSKPGTYTIAGIYEESADDAGEAGLDQGKGKKMWGGRLTTQPIEVKVEENRDAGQAAKQGVEGKVIKMTGDFMPGPEQVRGKLTPMADVNVHVFKGKLKPFEKPDPKHPALVTIVKTGQDGAFKAPLPAGEYTVVAEIKGKLYLNLYSGDGNWFTIEVKEGAWKHWNIEDSSEATF